MRYCLILSPRHHLLAIHLEGGLTSFPVPRVSSVEEAEEFYWESNCDPEYHRIHLNLIGDLLEVRGVTGVELHRYAVVVEKSPLFSWEGISNRVVWIIWSYVCPASDLVPADPGSVLAGETDALGKTPNVKRRKESER